MCVCVYVCVCVLQESVKCVVDALDFLGLYVLLTKFIGKGEREVKVLATAVGERYMLMEPSTMMGKVGTK